MSLLLGGIPSPNPTYPQDINVATGTQEVVVQNKNIFNGNIKIGNLNTNTGEEQTGYYYAITSNFVKVIPNSQISIQYAYNYDTSITGQIVVYQYGKDKSFKKFNAYSGKSYSITLDSDTYYIKIRFGGKNDHTNTISEYEQMQIEYGTATSYIAHQEQTQQLRLGDIELSKIGTYQDRIYKNNDKWYIEKNIGKVVLNGSETGWGTQNDVFCIEINDILTQSYDERSIIVLSNYFLGAITAYRGGINNLTIAKTIDNGKPKQLGIRYDTLNNVVADFKTWLSTHNTEVYYVLSTPTYEEITNETLIEELNELEKIMSYNGQTNISISGNLPMLVSVSALKGE